MCFYFDHQSERIKLLNLQIKSRIWRKWIIVYVSIVFNRWKLLFKEKSKYIYFMNFIVNKYKFNNYFMCALFMKQLKPVIVSCSIHFKRVFIQNELEVNGLVHKESQKKCVFQNLSLKKWFLKNDFFYLF